MISFIFSASTSRENLKIQKLALDVFQLSSASTLVLLVVRDAPASLFLNGFGIYTNILYCLE
jgi:hypothetical protein